MLVVEAVVMDTYALHLIRVLCSVTIFCTTTSVMYSRKAYLSR